MREEPTVEDILVEAGIHVPGQDNTAGIAKLEFDDKLDLRIYTLTQALAEGDESVISELADILEVAQGEKSKVIRLVNHHLEGFMRGDAFRVQQLVSKIHEAVGSDESSEDEVADLVELINTGVKLN